MPLFEYRCSDCRAQFEALTRNGGADVACPVCSSRSLSRLISRFAVSRQLTPCGTPAAERAPSCGFDPARGGCHCHGGS